MRKSVLNKENVAIYFVCFTKGEDSWKSFHYSAKRRRKAIISAKRPVASERANPRIAY